MYLFHWKSLNVRDMIHLRIGAKWLKARLEDVTIIQLGALDSRRKAPSRMRDTSLFRIGR